MDLQLPELGGLAATRILKGDGRTRHIPIAAYTSSTLKETAGQAAAAGCDALITKPIPPGDLTIEVRRLLAQRGTIGDNGSNGARSDGNAKLSGSSSAPSESTGAPKKSGVATNTLHAKHKT